MTVSITFLDGTRTTCHDVRAANWFRGALALLTPKGGTTYRAVRSWAAD